MRAGYLGRGRARLAAYEEVWLVALGHEAYR